MVLVGNKQDLSNERQVKYEEAKNLTDSWGMDYIETSAKTDFNCKEAFEKLATLIASSKNGPDKCCSCLIY